MTALALEYADTALAAVKDHPLFQYGNALQILGASAAYAGFKFDLHVKPNGNGVKAAIKLNGINADIAPNDVCALCPNCSYMLQQLVAVAREIDPHVFKAVAVSAGVQYFLCFNTHRFAGSCAHPAGESVFRHHRDISFFHEFRENSPRYHSMPLPIF